MKHIFFGALLLSCFMVTGEAHGQFGLLGRGLAASSFGRMGAGAAATRSAFGRTIFRSGGFGRSVSRASSGLRSKFSSGGKKSYQTYILKNPKTGQRYVGRTSGFGSPKQNVQSRLQNHHKIKEGYRLVRVDKSSFNKGAIRGREQQMLDFYRSAGRSGNGFKGTGAMRGTWNRLTKSQRQIGKSGNQINGIGFGNKSRTSFLKQSKAEFGSLRRMKLKYNWLTKQ